MNFYDVLAAEKLGGGIPTTNFFDLLFAQFISGKKWEVYEGTLPATLNANGDDMRQYRIYGNTGGVGDDSGTVSASYQPYSNITTPIYIGSDPLGKDEYIDYQAQKVYRMINSALTPTDPPVPLPALPTCEGTTIVDYAGQSVAPEKVVFEYAKGGS